MDDKLKAKYYFNKGKAYYANGNGSDADVNTAVEALGKVSTGYTKEMGELKRLMESDLLTKANELYKTQKYKEAAVKFENLYNMKPTDEIYLYYAAVSAVSGSDYDVALKHYLKLKEIGYTGVTTEYFAINKETGAEELFDKTTRDLYVSKLKTHISPGERTTESKVPEITKNIALIYVSQDKKEEALKAIKEARALNPDNSNLIMTEANIQYKLGNKEAYGALISEAVKKDPENTELLYNLGVLSTEAGDKLKAKEYYTKVLSLKPEHVNTLTNLAALVLGEESSIIEEMNGLGSSASDDRRYDELKAKRTELYKSAVPYLETVLKVDDKNVDVAKTLMNIYTVINENGKADALKSKFGL
jgi:tetratricopeptide (TPR) repeat protein